MSYAIRIDKADKLKLSKIDPGDTQGIDEPTAIAEATELGQELCSLQELLYAASMHSVLIVLQGMDTSGKDGTISHVFDSVNPSSVNVATFKVPTPLEQAHDFLWRIHQAAPPKGHMTIFNRSHYEDVLVVRVHKLVPDKVWKARYSQIAAFESQLASSNTIILKFFLHISNEEQERRLLARERDAEKAWKLSAGDWQERKLWDDYQSAYEDAIGKTGAPHAPWLVVPANHKWYRNLAVASAIVEALRPYRKEWEKHLEQVAQTAKADLAAMRAQDGGAPTAQRADTVKNGHNGHKHDGAVSAIPSKASGKHKHGK